MIIGLIIVSGMLVGTLFTLFVLPTMYSFLARSHQVSDQTERQKQLQQINN
ncbi:TPA: hypothetical protein SMN08_002298 [Proteus mirabilis]|nr:hypothetical protein [Proteus mirabilis]